AQTSLQTMSRLFPCFGSAWLAGTEPIGVDEKRKLLSLGIIYLTDVIVAEVGRQIGFLRAYHRLSSEKIFGSHQPSWAEIRGDVGIRLLEQVSKDWQLQED